MPHHIPKIEFGPVIPTTIDFLYPPQDGGEVRDAQETVTTSLAGARQVVLNHVEVSRKLKFIGITEAAKTALESFFDNFAVLGKSFKFFENALTADYISYELKDLKFQPKRIASAGANIYTYELEWVFRRVLGAITGEDFLQVELLNNQAVPVAIDGQVLDSSRYRSAKIFFEAFRKTDSEERIVNGFLTAVYVESLGTWDITPGGTFDGNASHGVTFSADAAGQIYYVSDPMAGANYEGELTLKNFVITE